MAEQPNPKKIKFETKKEMFDQVADEVTCAICKIVPRKIPLYMSPGGSVVCSDCRESNPGRNFVRNSVTMALEKVMSNLPRACRHRKNNCKIALELANIEYHEEDCQFREVICPMQYCTDICLFNAVSQHLKTKHNFDVSVPNKGVQKLLGDKKQGQTYVVKTREITKEQFDPSRPGWGNSWRHIIKLGTFFEKKFLLHFEVNPAKKSALFWVQIIGSKFETKNFKYSIQIEDKEFGTSIYKNHVISLDHNKEDVYKSSTVLMINTDILEKFIGDNLIIEIEIENLKPKEENANSDYDE